MKYSKNTQYTSIVVGVCACIALFVVHHERFNGRPTPDFAKLPTYITALNRSRDPEMVAIRKEIADGPYALAREEKIAQADGIPWTVAQVEPPMPPPGQNAAPLYQRLVTLQQHKPLRLPVYAEELQYGYAYTPKEIAIVQNTVSQRNDVFGLLDKATDIPRCVLPISQLTGPAALVDNESYGSMSYYEDIDELTTQSTLLGLRGEVASAVEMEDHGFTMAQSVASVPQIRDYDSAADVERETLEQMSNILRRSGMNLAIDAQIAADVRANADKLTLREEIINDLVVTMALLEEYKADPDALTSMDRKKMERLNAGQRRFSLRLVDATEARVLSVYISLIEAVHLPDAARREFYASVSIPGFDADGSELPTNTNPVIALYQDCNYTDYTSYIDYVDRLDVQEQVVLVADAVLVDKARTGKLPNVLPTRFIDPFSGKPLGYQKQGNDRFVIYSGGTNAKIIPSISWKTEPYSPDSVIFRYPAQPAKPIPASMLKVHNFDF